MTASDPHRLPGTVVPHHYDLTFEPDLSAATFSGREVVTLEVLEPSTEIVLNAAELEIDQAFLTRDESRVDLQVTLQEDLERATLISAEPVRPGTWQLHVRFRGMLNDQLRGFYRSTFTDDEGDERVIATTQFEATDARRAFPCWDEPELKAVFSVELIVGRDDFGVSNTREVERADLDDGRVRIQFADTIKMSTYLVAFIVGPLEATEPVDAGGTPVRVVHTPGKGHLTGFALQVGAQFLTFFNDYYGIPYPGDKLDLVALPDFAFGAMENLGAVTFRENLLLVEPSEVGQLELSRIADVVAHELAHMWFGDLVTMRWWNGIWLNEAFATFMELVAVDAYRPDWKRWLAFARERTHAMHIDALEATRSIEYPVAAPAEADEMFDPITYGKGSAVLRMLEQFIGPDGFQTGVRDYLEKHRFGNTETGDLWNAIENASGEPASEIMESWIFQGGFPALLVSREEEGIRIRQRRFTYIPNQDDAARWSVPVLIRYGTPSGVQTTRLVLREDAVVTDDEPIEWIVVNAGGHGFYTVGYSPDLFAALLDRLPRLEDLERYTLASNLLGFVNAGDAAAAEFLDLADRYEGESEHAVWQTIAAGFDILRRIIAPHGESGLAARARRLAAPALEELGWEPGPDEDELTRHKRGLLIDMVGRIGQDDETLRRSRVAVAATGGTADPDVLRAAIGVVANRGTADDYEEFLERYRTSESPQVRYWYLHALADFPDNDLAARTFEMTLNGEVRTQDGPFLVGKLFTNRVVNDHVWGLYEDNWDRILDTFPPLLLRRTLATLQHLSDAQLAPRVLRFFDGREVPHSTRTLAQHLELLRARVALREREGERLADFVG